MYVENRAWGLGYINHFVPSVLARDVLETVNAAGYHRVNGQYDLQYPQGITAVLLLFTLSGSGSVQCGAQQREVRAGDVMIFPPGTAMRYGTQGDAWEFYWLNVNGMRMEKIALLLQQEGKNSFASGQMAEYVGHADALLHLTEEKLSQEVEISARLNALEDGLLSEMMFRKGQGKRLSARMADYLEGHHQEKITLTELSRRFYLSPNRLIEVFSGDTGRTPYAYLMEYRLARARELLLNTDLSAAQIAAQVGFGSASNFGYQFTRAYGQPPLQFRRATRARKEK